MANRAPIIEEWKAFALTCAPASGAMNVEALADHADAMLTVMARDLETPQNVHEASEKSKGLAPESPEDPDTAAEEHGAGRAESGFSIEQMVAEFRALRASVTRLWVKSQNGAIAESDIDDLTRFNEAIDQALAESVTRYTQDLDNSKEMFLAMLGHDLRSPLAAIMMSVQFMLETAELVEPHLTLAGRIDSSANRMQHMIGDLLDFTRSRLGGGIPITRGKMSMQRAVHDVVEEICAANPGRIIKINARGGTDGDWDSARISQALTNLVGNAVQNSSEGSVVSIDVKETADEIMVSVHNNGPPIPSDQLNGIFGPMKSRETAHKKGGTGAYGNLGLGLFIAERIVGAHQGTIDVKSERESGTTFTIHLPRAEAATPPSTSESPPESTTATTATTQAETR